MTFDESMNPRRYIMSLVDAGLLIYMVSVATLKRVREKSNQDFSGGQLPLLPTAHYGSGLRWGIRKGLLRPSAGENGCDCQLREIDDCRMCMNACRGRAC